jgi:hypothetical protein
MRSDFAAFILTHGRPDNVKTYEQLRKQGYTGRIVIVVDDTDAKVNEYRERYGDEVFVFDKKAIAKKTDSGDNFDDLGSVVYARNACFEIAESLGILYFVQLDDDYNEFNFRFCDELKWVTRDISSRNLDHVFGAFLSFLLSTPTNTIAMAQGGDFIGGRAGRYGSEITLRRKAMNSFFCETSRRFWFLGRFNDDVNTYTLGGPVGRLFFTHNQIALNQVQTQASDGGMTEAYLASGTYVKSFYTVMMHPSGASVRMMNSRSNPRLHHSIAWNNTTPMIIREKVRHRYVAHHRV